MFWLLLSCINALSVRRHKKEKKAMKEHSWGEWLKLAKGIFHNLEHHALSILTDQGSGTGCGIDQQVVNTSTVLRVFFFFLFAIKMMMMIILYFVPIIKLPLSQLTRFYFWLCSSPHQVGGWVGWVSKWLHSAFLPAEFRPWKRHWTTLKNQLRNACKHMYSHKYM